MKERTEEEILKIYIHYMITRKFIEAEWVYRYGRVFRPWEGCKVPCMSYEKFKTYKTGVSTRFYYDEWLDRFEKAIDLT